MEPVDCKPVPEAIAALKEAEIIVLGPGSLYTSVIPNLLVTEIAEAIRNSTAIKVYVCNAMTEAGETDDYSASRHIEAIVNHAGRGLVDIAVVNNEAIDADILERYAEEGAEPVAVDLEAIARLGITPLAVRIITKTNYIRHDAAKLARIILEIYRAHRIERAFGKSFTKRIYPFLKSLVGLFIAK